MSQKNLINKLLDKLIWKPLPNPMPWQSQPRPFATHQGILKIGDFEFHVLQLNTGERVLMEEEVKAFFGGLLGEWPEKESKT